MPIDCPSWRLLEDDHLAPALAPDSPTALARIKPVVDTRPSDIGGGARNADKVERPPSAPGGSLK